MFFLQTVPIKEFKGMDKLKKLSKEFKYNVFENVLKKKLNFLGKNRKSDINLKLKTKGRSSPKSDNLAGNIISEDITKFDLVCDASGF